MIKSNLKFNNKKVKEKPVNIVIAIENRKSLKIKQL